MFHRVLDRKAHDLAILVDVEQNVFVEFRGLGRLAIVEFDVKRVRFDKLLHLHRAYA